MLNCVPNQLLSTPDGLVTHHVYNRLEPWKVHLIQLQVKLQTREPIFIHLHQEQSGSCFSVHIKWLFCFIFNLTALEVLNERMQWIFNTISKQLLNSTVGKQMLLTYRIWRIFVSTGRVKSSVVLDFFNTAEASVWWSEI